MIKKLVNVGNSRALIIDKAILGLLGITDSTDVDITTDGRSILITPIGAKDGRSKFQETVAEVNLVVSGTRVKRSKAQ